MEAEDRSGRSDLDTDSCSHCVSGLDGMSSGVVDGDVLSDVALSKDVGRMERSLSESVVVTLARALPA